MSILGNRVLRTEDPRFLTVGGTYVADLRDPRLDGALHVTFVRSTAPHAEILGIDASDAQTMPGVVAVITGADIDIGPIGPPVPGINDTMTRPFLATDRVRFVGEPVAAVLSEHPAQGADAAESVWVDYAPLPAVVDPEAAAGDEVLLFPATGTNLAVEFDFGRNDALFDGCEVVVSERLVNQRLAACPLEVRGAAAAYVDDRLVLWLSTQNVHGVREALVTHYGLEPDDMLVIAPDVGGGFGPKIGAHPEELLLPFLAKRVGRPVRWVETRTENMLAMGQGRGQIQIIEIGGRSDGAIEAYRLSVLQDCGAYPTLGAFLPYLTRMMATGTYAIPRIECSTSSVVTNTTPTLAYRGAGRPEATAAIERAVDLFAAEIGMDPVEVRRRNLIPAFDTPFTTALETTYDCGDYARALETAVAAVGYDELRHEQARRREANETMALGIGVSTYVEITAGPGAGDEYARVEIEPDGGAAVYTGSSAHGQGHDTAFAMIASDELAIPMDRIRVVHGDTDLVPRGTGTFGSRSLQLGGAAVQKAARELVESGTEVAAKLLEANVDDVTFNPESGRFETPGSPDGCSWADVGDATGGLSVDGEFLAAQPTFPFGAHIAVVEVDTETGEARLRRILAVDDAGRILNPLLAEGQRHGGIAQGVAQALYEEIRYDPDGNPRTTNLADYGMISAAELPMFELVSMETPTWVNPLGAKGIGESGTIGSTPAVQNAVCDALAHLGVRHVDLPCTSEHIWRAIVEAGGDA